MNLTVLSKRGVNDSLAGASPVQEVLEITKDFFPIVSQVFSPFEIYYDVDISSLGLSAAPSAILPMVFLGIPHAAFAVNVTQSTPTTVSIALSSEPGADFTIKLLIIP